MGQAPVELERKYFSLFTKVEFLRKDTFCIYIKLSQINFANFSRNLKNYHFRANPTIGAKWMGIPLMGSAPPLAQEAPV